MSNRRFRKTFSELRQMNQAAASQFVETNLISAIARYSGIYEHTMQILLQHYKTNSAVQPTKGFAFEVGFTKPGDEGRETLMGEKMKVFSLIWISGMLRLADSREEVEQVVRLALKQKKALDSDSTLQPMVKQSMLKSGILYNPEVLSSGLIGVTYREAGMESDVMKAAGIRWQQRTLAAYDAALTEFDKPVQSGVLVPDRSTGSLTVNFVSHMNDTNFDLLLREIHFK